MNYVDEAGLGIDAMHFFYHYQSVGCKIGGGQPIEDRKAEAHNWEKHEGEF